MLSPSPDGRAWTLPALCYAHSHAFQRAMRGAAQRPKPVSGAPVREDFWSWRGAMYAAASALDPESIHRISKVAFDELHAAGVRTVGEFHYIQHQADGTPYDDRTVMSDAVIRAAKDAGLRIALLRVAYHRAGPGRVAEPGQRRFCDPRVEDVLRDVETLRAKYKNDPDVRVGVAPHSVRAVPPAWIKELATWAATAAPGGLPFHMHVAEQPREIEECFAETGKRPVELIADQGALSPRFAGVHTTHLLPHEAKLLGDAKAFACICASTEADLGDGVPDLGSLRASGVRLCTGIDSYIVVDPIADLRALETLERLRTGARVTFDPKVRTPAEQLWHEGSVNGALACGFEDEGGRVNIRKDHPSLALAEEELVLDAIVFGGGASLFG
jgi:formimidoylglutamate deiminase